MKHSLSPDDAYSSSRIERKRSSGHAALDQTALKGALDCRFVAATVDGKPVPSWEKFRFSWVDR